jgi:hypothetical protein
MRAIIVAGEHRNSFQSAIRSTLANKRTHGALAVFAMPFEKGPTQSGDYEYYGISDRVIAATREAGIPFRLA